ncbi:MAG: hypothetical protein SFW66_08870 [Gammaproteobacteria bacterium]|nr:hypothetical protein [Gammaproteobacteria bacterium]
MKEHDFLPQWKFWFTIMGAICSFIFMWGDLRTDIEIVKKDISYIKRSITKYDLKEDDNNESDSSTKKSYAKKKI